MFRGKRVGYLATIIGVIIAQFIISPAFASVLQSLKITINDARPSVTSLETAVLQLSASNTFATGETIVYDWPANFTFPADGTWITGDFTFNDGTGRTIVAVGAAPSCSAGANNVTVTASQTNKTLTVTACASYSASGSGATVTFGVGSTNFITNPTTGTYQVNVDETTDDAKDTAVAIIDGVTLSATIDETLTHTTAGVTTANCPNPAGAGSETEIDTSGSATTVPFGTVNTEAFYGACQQLTVSTNAASGYVTTVKTTTRPTAGANTISEGTCDGSCTDTTEAAWATATNNGYAYCMSNQTGTPASTADSGWSSANNGCNSSGTTFFKTINRVDASETGQDILKSTTAISGDSAYIKYRLSVDAAQAAGAYTTTIIYVTTATF